MPSYDERKISGGTGSATAVPDIRVTVENVWVVIEMVVNSLNLNAQKYKHARSLIIQSNVGTMNKVGPQTPSRSPYNFVVLLYRCTVRLENLL